ncbi:hypothetical protein [Nonomuraea africana]|uniref:Tfp pilus assembly protein PilX n=1 Tax=Nonomuraea africana TaxID=46171 RepID=A0ABR9K9T1_9ACTN|nr:hypothetical protein [Nonomuraea africana]MBE1558770.1 Tfp pilus assembly protein PilX [Nonomuraea africana]
MRIDHIPVAGGEPPAGAEPSRVRSLIRELRPSRRSALKGLGVAVATAALVPLEWVFTKSMALAAGPTSEWTRSNCTDGYPNGYGQQSNNWWVGGTATCFGGWRRGSYPCSGGYHFEGWRGYSDEGYTSSRTASYCGTSSTRNAWRWTTSGLVYRCSDAITTCVWNSGERHTALTISMCRV